TDTPGISVSWQWGAAVYSNFTPSEAAIQVKTVADSHVDTYRNSDPAGTPENFKSYLTGGATGGGWSNWTGSSSGTASLQPEVQTAPPTGTASITGNVQYSEYGGDEVGNVVGATVTLTDANGNVVATTTTDSNGNYSFGSLVAGTYTITVTDSDYNSASPQTQSLSSGQAATDNFTLS
ncbi:MAG TPA: carboxypeptidase-like regulatory domain-containing protein, partial [Gemmata sp.]|nr:carboxypeptidase-like regulatory domain-containing protein [Gemmata sp.]